MSGESTPLLSGAVPAFELLIISWKNIVEKAAHLKPIVDIGLTWADTYAGKMGETMAYAVAMCQFGVPQ